MSYNKEYNYVYETVAASASAQVLGNVGKAGNYLASLIIVPATTTPGAVSITDGTGSAITIFVGGTITTVAPIPVPVGLKSTTGPWKVTTGLNVSVIAVGDFND